MIKLKKTTIALFALSSGIAFEGTMGPVCAPGNVTVPCQKTAWSFGGQALYLQPNYSGPEAGYDLYPRFAGALANSNTTWQSISPAWQWGFQLEGDYHFGTGKDVDINWYRLHNTNSVVRGFNALDANLALTSTIVSNTISTNPQWDAVNVEFGQHVDFDELSQMRLHGGIEYARIATNINTGLSSTVYTTSTAMSYNGFGPRVGMDLSYGLNGISSTLSGLNIYGKAASALLVGSRGFNTTVITQHGTAYTSGSQAGSIVPELEAKLGAKYTYATTRGDLDFDIGWMWNNYFNVQNAAYSEASATVINAYFPSNSDFGLQGLYFGLKWTGELMA